MVNDAAEIKLRAERKGGQLLHDVGRENGKRTDATSLQPATKLQNAIKEAGIEPTQAHRWQAIASIPEQKFERVIAPRARVGRRSWFCPARKG